MATERIGVVGAGILGLAVARRLTQVNPGASVTVLDKENAVARHQTGHNSGVAHAGVYYAPGSLKATLCRRGVTMLKEYCGQNSIPYEECGKLIVARDQSELGRLTEIERRATQNGVPGLRRLSPAEMVEIEPQVRGVAALHSPSTAIVDFHAVAVAMAEELESAGAKLRLGFEVSKIERPAAELRIASPEGEQLAFDQLVVCGGLQSDRLARLAGETGEPGIIPFRGEYLRLIPSRRDLVRGLIYPVPDPAFPFLGVHFTRRIDGGVDIGPNAVLALAREGYRRADVDLREILNIVRNRGFRALARRHWRTGLREMRGSLSRRAFLADAQRFIPSLTLEDVEPAPAGVRAQAVDADGTLVDDFRIQRSRGILLVRNAPSPAATSSLAIAEHVVSLLQGSPTNTSPSSMRIG